MSAVKKVRTANALVQPIGGGAALGGTEGHELSENSSLLQPSNFTGASAELPIHLLDLVDLGSHRLVGR